MRTAHALYLTIGILVLAGDSGEAQVSSSAGRVGATRRELELLASRAEVAGSADTAALRERLREGDFRSGDHIVLTVPADSALSDTFVVRGGSAGEPVLALPNLPDTPLRGVLRSELHSRIVAVVGQYLKDTLLHVSALVPIGVLGELARPGYYRVPIDAAFTDVIMAAGGPTPNADMTRITVRRGAKELLSRPAVREAMAEGVTLDALGLVAGDEVLVEPRRERRWTTTTMISAASLLSSLVIGLFASGVVGGR